MLNAFSIILAQKSGKIKICQKVNIQLANYPNREFGKVEETIKAIALTPYRDGNILIDISLPNGLKTSCKKQNTFQQEMTGTSDIINQDLRLIEGNVSKITILIKHIYQTYKRRFRCLINFKLYF